MLTIAVVARSAAVRTSLAEALAGAGRYIVGAVTDRVTALREGDADIDVILVESDGGTEGWEEELGDVPAVVVLSEQWPESGLAQRLRQHGGALLPADASPQALWAAIDAAAAGLLCLDVRAASAALDPIAAGVDEVLQGEPLTSREAQVLELLADGHSNKAIARLLDVSEHTAKFHVSAVLAKLGVASRTEAVAVGMRRGLVSL